MSFPQLTLRVVNNSADPVDACLYQRYPDVGLGEFPLAWIVRSVPPGPPSSWTWSVDQLTFVWAQTGVLAPGGQFDTVQEWPADPQTHQPAGPTAAGDCVGLTVAEDNYTFFSLSSEPTVPAGALLIASDRIVLGGQVSVGIGNSGSAVIAAQAVPSVNLVLTPQPRYFITAGTYSPGEVLDLAQISNPAEIVFPAGYDCMTAVFEPDGVWHIEPGQQSAGSVHEKKMVTH